MTRSEESPFFRVSKLVAIAFLLFTVSVANAAPTISNCNRNIVDCTVPPSSDVHTAVVRGVTRTPEYSDSPLAAIAAEFLKPPASFTDLATSPPIHVKSLPAAPAAILMVLIGFLCVSLVRDRRVWLAALAGLIWAGHAGVHAVPQLALRLSHQNHSKQQLCAELTYPYYLENSNRLRSDIEGTQYIGLLHYLAGIPDASSAFTNTRLGTLITFSQPSQKLYSKVLSYPYKNTYPYLSAIIPEQYGLNSLLACLVSKAEQSICFSPALIFELIPRGPPRLA